MQMSVVYDAFAPGKTSVWQKTDATVAFMADTRRRGRGKKQKARYSVFLFLFVFLPSSFLYHAGLGNLYQLYQHRLTLFNSFVPKYGNKLP